MSRSQLDHFFDMFGPPNRGTNQTSSLQKSEIIIMRPHNKNCKVNRI